MPTPFFNSNVLLYLAASTTQKAQTAEERVKLGGVISVQVLNECISVLRGKLRTSWHDIDMFLTGVRANCQVVPLTEATHDLARAYAERFGFRIYDASILAAANLAGCDTLWSEDMQHGQVVDGVTIRNPFGP